MNLCFYKFFVSPDLSLDINKLFRSGRRPREEFLSHLSHERFPWKLDKALKYSIIFLVKKLNSKTMIFCPKLINYSTLNKQT